MTVVGLHPEELFDKLQDGELSPPERERLSLHLDSCEVCRFEYATRLDFQAEALELAALGPPPALPLRPLTTSEPASEAAGTPVPARRRRRSRGVVWGLAAAALITASGAVASGLAGKSPWDAARLLFSQTTKPSDVQAAALRKKPVVAAPVVAAALPETAAPAVMPTVALVAGHVREASKPRATAAKGATALAAVSPPAELASAKDGAAKEPPSAAKLFGEANQARRSGDVGRASGLYHLLQEQFPGSPEAELSRVTLALLLLDSGDAQAALSGFERYLAGSSRGLEAEALVGRARALGRLGRRNLEVAAWQEVQRKYSRSIYGRQATERLSALGLP